MRYEAWFHESYWRDFRPSRKKFGDSWRIETGAAFCAGWGIMRTLLLFAALLFSGKTLRGMPTQTTPDPTTAVLFDFSRPVSEPFWEALQGELDQNTAPVSPERSMKWMKRQQLQKGMEFPEVVQVRLRGHCNADLPTGRQVAGGPLGWVYLYTINGEIQPIAYVNCDQIARTLEREFRGTNSRARQQKFARAISRVVAHELTHIFTQSAHHSPSGLQRACLSADELTKKGLLPRTGTSGASKSQRQKAPI
jgi:hypothetical protein